MKRTVEDNSSVKHSLTCYSTSQCSVP